MRILSVTLDGTILRVNQTLLEWTAFSRAELLGRRSCACSLRAARSSTRPGSFPSCAWRVGREIAMEIRRADGTPLHILTNSTVVQPADGAPRSCEPRSSTRPSGTPTSVTLLMRAAGPRHPRRGFACCRMRRVPSWTAMTSSRSRTCLSRVPGTRSRRRRHPFC